MLWSVDILGDHGPVGPLSWVLLRAIWRLERPTGELYPVVADERRRCSEMAENSLSERLLEVRGGGLA